MREMFCKIKISRYAVTFINGFNMARILAPNVDSPNLGFPYFYFLGGYQWKKNTL